MNQIVLKELISLTKGKKPQTITSDEPIGFLPYVDIKAFETNIIEKYTDGEKCIECNDGDLLIVCDGSRSGLIGKAVKGYVGSTLARIDCDSRIDKDYLYYFIQSKYMLLNSNVKGTGTPHLKQDLLKSFSLILPSIEKQKQIVKQIEESLSQLDSAVATLKKTKQQLEIYRQAVLKEAFANFKEFTTIRNAASLVTSGSRGWAKYYSASGAAFIRIGNLNRYDISISLDDLQCVKLPDHAEGVRSRLEPSDVLISITADLGSIGLVPYNIGEGYINQHIALVRFKNKKQSRFLAWYLRSDIGQKELLKNKRGAGKLGLGLDDIRDSLIPVVDDTTAIEVVSKIEEKLVLCSNIEETVNQSLQQAEALRQSILRQAFEVE